MKNINRLEIAIAGVAEVKDYLKSKNDREMINAKNTGLALVSVCQALAEIRDCLVKMDCERAEIRKELDNLLSVLNNQSLIKVIKNHDQR